MCQKGDQMENQGVERYIPAQEMLGGTLPVPKSWQGDGKRAPESSLRPGDTGSKDAPGQSGTSNRGLHQRWAGLGTSSRALNNSLTLLKVFFLLLYLTWAGKGRVPVWQQPS